MAIIDRALRGAEFGEAAEHPVQDQEFVLSHGDNVDASGLVQLRAGRVRTIVEEAYSHYARSTTIVSAEDTTIDGERIHLG